MSGWRTLSLAILGPVAALALLASQALADESPTPDQQAAALANVPKDAQQYYQGYWYSTKLVADPLANWQPHKAPWQICHNDSYLGNSWRANLVAELQELTSQLAKQGLAKDNLIVTNSNGDINLELTQLKTQIAQGCDLIMMYPGSATGLCSGIRDAFDKGVLVVTIDAPVDCPQAINVARNPYFYAKLQGDWIMKQLGGKGNVVLMNGQPGTTDTVAEHEAFLEAAKANPDVKITGDLYGMWTGAVAKSEMLKYLATHPQAVDAVWSTGNMGVGVGQALEQAGRPVTIVTDVTNQCSFLAFWKGHKFSSSHDGPGRRPNGLRGVRSRDPDHVRPEAEGEHDLLSVADHHQRQHRRLLRSINDGAEHLLCQRQGSPPGHRRLL